MTQRPADLEPGGFLRKGGPREGLGHFSHHPAGEGNGLATMRQQEKVLLSQEECADPGSGR